MRMIRWPLTSRRLVYLLGLPVLLYLSVATLQKTLDLYRIEQRKAAVRAEIVQLQEQHAALLDEIAYLQSDAYVEYAARTELKLVRPGDRLVVPAFVPAPTPPPADTAVNFQPPANPPTWQQWWERFFGERR